MRTTLDIDDDVLQAAKDLARAERKTAGEVISDLARKALTRSATTRRFKIQDGLPLLPKRGQAATPELVQRLLEDEP
jgi:hypothetical protein